MPLLLSWGGVSEGWRESKSAMLVKLPAHYRKWPQIGTYLRDPQHRAWHRAGAQSVLEHMRVQMKE